MSINNKKAEGDDQAWKREVEKVIEQLTKDVAFLKAQLRNQDRRLNS